MTYRIMCIGEPLAEISMANASSTVGFGGDILNTAIYCARAARDRDVQVHLVSAVGQDPLSDGAITLLSSEGVDTSFVTRDPDRQIGIYAIKNNEGGGRKFHYWRETSAARKMFSVDNDAHFAAIQTADLVYLSGISLAILSQDARNKLWDALAARRYKGLIVAFDSKYRPELWSTVEVASREVMRFWQITDIALPTEEDEIALFGDVDRRTVIDRILAAGATSGALKCGQEGPLQLPLATIDTIHAKAPSAIETTGAGDSFNGTYLAAIARGKSAETAISEAHKVATSGVGQVGAVLPAASAVKPKRVGSVIRLRPEHLAEYCRLHADVWPGVLQRLRASNFTNYSIYLKRPECLMFGYFEYVGTDFAADDAAVSADPITKDWWAVCGPMQNPFETRAEGEWWAEMEEVFHLE